jgi:hypothetical protein
MKNRFCAFAALITTSFVFGDELCARAQSLADFNVLSPGFFYTFNNDSTQNPVITLERGRTYTFNISTDAFHPFQILPGTGVENNNINSGVITWNVPADAQNGSFFYQCSFHGFGNSFNFVDPVSAAPIQLLSLSISTNLVLVSTGGNATNLFPEFSTNLATTNWYGLTVTSNRFFSGTNETICGRPPGPNVFVRIRAKAN